MTKASRLTAYSLTALALLVGFSFPASAGIVTPIGDSGLNNEWQRFEFFAASSTDATLITATGHATSTDYTFTDSSGRINNGYMVLKGAEAVSLFFTRNGASNSVATSTFSVQVSPDGSTWIDYNKLISNTTNTNSQQLTRVSSVQLVGATSTVMVSLDLQFDAPFAVRCIATFASTTIETNDSNRCVGTAKY